MGMSVINRRGSIQFDEMNAEHDFRVVAFDEGLVHQPSHFASGSPKPNTKIPNSQLHEIECGCCSVSSVRSDLLLDGDNDNWSLSSISCQSLPCDTPEPSHVQCTMHIHPPPFSSTPPVPPLCAAATVVSRDTQACSRTHTTTAMEDDESSIMSVVSSAASSLIDEANLRMISFQFDADFLGDMMGSPTTGRLLDGVLSDDVLCHVTSFLSLPDMARLTACSKLARELCINDENGWKDRCERLWSKKSFVPSHARDLLYRRRPLEAYRFSIEDGANRQSLHDDELCYDPDTQIGIVWDFRFKETAGPEWTTVDPWWAGGKARKMVFLKNGLVKQLMVGPNGSKHLIPPFSSPSTNEQRHPHSSDIEMKWRYVSQPMDLPVRVKGSYIRLTVDGRDVPTYLVHRSPTGDWSFVLESCWGVFSSSEFVPRLQAPTNDPRASSSARRPPRMRLRRTRDGGRWLDVNGIESEDEAEDVAMEVASQQYLARHPQPPPVSRDDLSFAVSTSTLWREALLYNAGAVSLPDGENATAEFDRLWNQTS